MRKRVVLSFLTWICIWILLGILFLWQMGPFAVAAILFWTILPLVSWGLNLYSKKQIRVSIKTPAMASKKQEIQGTFVVKNKGRLPIGCIYCKAEMKNRLTGECKTQWIVLSAAAKDRTEKSFQFSCEYCGYVVIKIEELYLMDWFGFLPVRVKTEAVSKCSVVPDTFSLDILLSISTAQSSDSDSWSQVQKGNDYSEVFAIREYVPGDSLKQIHWKLSSKLNELLVKEPSLPTEKSLLLFWDKNTAEADPKEMDAMAEVTASVAQVLTEQGVPYKFGWTDGGTVVLEDVESEEQLIPLIPRMIKTGREQAETDRNSQNIQENFGKIIYFSKEIPEDLDMFCFTDLVYVLCGSQQDSQWMTVSYGPETYAEDLQKIEL